jgi:hypothetical protein
VIGVGPARWRRRAGSGDMQRRVRVDKEGLEGALAVVLNVVRSRMPWECGGDDEAGVRRWR